MEHNCNKYEALFVFSNDEELKKHIETCEICKKEQNTMDKVSSLIKEAGFEIKKQRERKVASFKAASIFLVIFLGSAAIMLFSGSNADANFYGEILSAYDYGFPVDSYGLIAAD